MRARAIAWVVLGVFAVAGVVAVVGGKSGPGADARSTSEAASPRSDAGATAPSPVAGPRSTSPTAVPLDVPTYRVIKSDQVRRIPRGEWVDVATYRVQPHLPTTHLLQVNVAIRNIANDRPSYLAVRWVVNVGPGWRDESVGVQSFPVPTARGDRPFQITHKYTTAGHRGAATAQIFIEGSGEARVPLSVAKALVWASVPDGEN